MRRSERPSDRQEQAKLQRDDLAGVDDQSGGVRRGNPRSVHGSEIFFGDPTGHGATLSDEHRHRVLDGFDDEVTQRGQADAL